MRITRYLSRIATCLMLILMIVMVGCEKESDPVVPGGDDPTDVDESNYFVCGADSLDIRIVVVMLSSYKGDVMDWSFKLSDSQILKLYTTKNLQAGGSYPIVGETVAYNGGDGVYGVYMEGFEEEELKEGTVEVRQVEGRPEFTLRATTKSGRSVRMHYYGEIHDLTHPLGTGQFTFGNESLPLQIAYSQLYYDLYEYAFTDTVSSFGVTFYSTTPLAGGTYVITDDMQAVDRGEALNLYLYIESANGNLIGDVTNGSATCTLSGDEFTITFEGELEGVAVGGSYSGRIEALGESIL